MPLESRPQSSQEPARIRRRTNPEPKRREETDMSEITEKLPVLPLSAGVVLPHMNVTIQLDSAEARAAVAAANLAETRQVVLLPKVGGRYAAVGTVAKLEDTGSLPGGEEIVVVQGRHRAVVGKAEADLTEIGRASCRERV